MDMVRPFLHLLLIIAFCFAPAHVRADGLLHLIGIRGNEATTRAFAEKNHLSELSTDTKEFDDGNTGVRFTAPVNELPVVILLPVKMTTNQFMEALIKVRTAKALGAPTVSILVPGNLEKIEIVDAGGTRIPLHVAPLLKEAGTDSVKEGDTPMAPLPQLGKTEKALVISQNYLWNPSQESLGKGIAEKTGIAAYPERSNDSLKGSRVFLISDNRSTRNDSLFWDLSRVQKLKKRGAQVFRIPGYLDYSRADKIDQPGITTVGRLAADLIEAAGTDEIAFVRAHAPQSSGFFKIPVHNISGRPTLSGYLRDKNVDLIISPDNGFAKDATLYADDLGLPAPKVLNKQRNPVTQETEFKGGSDLSDVRGKVVAIIDDETASGKTQHKAAKVLKEAGAVKVIAIVTHKTGTAEVALQSPYIDEVVVTNTLPVRDSNHPKLRVIDISGEIAQELRATKILNPDPKRCTPQAFVHALRELSL